MPKTFTRVFHLVLVAVLTVCGASALAAESEGRLFGNIHTFTLENGLEVAVIESHRAPVVTHMVWYRVGAVDEKPGKTGLAHFLEHLMFKGSENVPAGEFSKIIARNGGSDNAFTSSDYTAYFQNIAADKLDLVMRMEADRMGRLDIAEDEVATERAVVVEERRQRTESSPLALFREQFQTLQFTVHPYRNPVVGWMADLASLTQQDARDFYDHYYAPNNAILVVAGDVEVDEVRALAEKHYGVLPSRDVPPRTHPQEPPSWAARELEMTHEQATQPNWTRTWLAPSYQHGRSEHAPALQVLSEILGGGTTSRLYQKLVVEDGLAVSLSSWYRPQALGPATFGVSITPSDGNIELLSEAVAQEIELLRREGPSDQELSRAKRQLTASAIFVQDDISGLANVVGSALASGRSIDDLRRWPSEIEAITAADISAAIDYVFRDNRAVTGRLLPAPESAASKEAGQ